MDKIQPYRQPMVTATGIFMGFLLNFTSEWSHSIISMQKTKDIFIAISILSSLCFLLISLFRILRMEIPIDPVKFYRKTLYFFLLGITIPFVAFLIIIISKF